MTVHVYLYSAYNLLPSILKCVHLFLFHFDVRTAWYSAGKPELDVLLADLLSRASFTLTRRDFVCLEC